MSRLTFSSAFKVLITGDASVGKSSLRQRICGDTYTGDTVQTVNVELPYKCTTITSQNHMFNMWCCERESASHYVGANYAIVMFDVTRGETFNNVVAHINRLRDLCGDIAISLCANKVDVDISLWDVDMDDIKQLALDTSLKIFYTSKKVVEDGKKMLKWFLAPDANESRDLLSETFWVEVDGTERLRDDWIVEDCDDDESDCMVEWNRKCGGEWDMV